MRVLRVMRMRRCSGVRASKPRTGARMHGPLPAEYTPDCLGGTPTLNLIKARKVAQPVAGGSAHSHRRIRWAKCWVNNSGSPPLVA